MMHAVETQESHRARILFVDDDPAILRALARAFRRDVERWDITFAHGGENALAAMTLRPFDVVVTDLEMPRIDGRAVIHAAKAIRPQTWCVVQTGSELDPKQLPEADVLLGKPLSSHVLRALLERFVSAARP